jgi:hypothetical protein
MMNDPILVEAIIRASSQELNISRINFGCVPVPPEVSRIAFFLRLKDWISSPPQACQYLTVCDQLTLIDLYLDGTDMEAS